MEEISEIPNSYRTIRTNRENVIGEVFDLGEE